jgi:hypothetical protein
MTVHSTIVHATVHIPEGRQSVAAVEDRFRAGSPAVPLARGVLQRMYGLAERTVADDLEQPSDLAAHAARRLCRTDGRGDRRDRGRPGRPCLGGRGQRPPGSGRPARRQLSGS